MDLDPKNLGVALRPSYYTLRNGGGKGRRAPGAAPSLVARVRASALTNADVGWRVCDGLLAWGRFFGRNLAGWAGVGRACARIEAKKSAFARALARRACAMFVGAYVRTRVSRCMTGWSFEAANAIDETARWRRLDRHVDDEVVALTVTFIHAHTHTCTDRHEHTCTNMRTYAHVCMHATRTYSHEELHGHAVSTPFLHLHPHSHKYIRNIMCECEKEARQGQRRTETETETETAKGKWSSESGGGDLQCFSLLANETDKDVYPHHSLSWAVQVTKR